MQYELNCEWCGLPFLSNQPQTRFCCDSCAKLYSKQKYRQIGIDALEAKMGAQTSATLRDGLRLKDTLTTAEASLFLGVCRATISRYTSLGLLPVVHLPGKNLFRRTDLERLMETDTDKASVSSQPNASVDMSEYITVINAARQYGISPTALHLTLTNSGISPIHITSCTYFRKADVRTVLGKSPLKDVLITKTWVTHEQVELEYRLTRTEVTRMLRELHIPHKKQERVTYYSMEHIRARKKQQEESFNELYYTVPQIMEKFYLTEQRIYGILARYKVRRFKCGANISVVRKDFDRVFSIPEFNL